MALTPRMTGQRQTLLALVVILLLAMGLRVYRIDAQSLWYDEGASLRYAERTAAQIWRTTAADIHPPGYYILLSGWTRLLGLSEFALRGLSTLFGVLLVAQVYDLGRRLFNPAVGLLAAALIAIDPFHIYYAQEARMYTLLAALGAGSLWLLLRWLDSKESILRARVGARHASPLPETTSFLERWFWLAGLALVNVAAMYTHYIFPFFIAAESLLVLAWWLWESPNHPHLVPAPVRGRVAAGREGVAHSKQRRARTWRLGILAEWAVLQAVTFVLYLPWLPVALRHVTGFPRAQAALSWSNGALDMGSLLAYGVTLPVEAGAGGLIPLGLLALVGLLPPIDEETRPSFGWRLGLVLAWLMIPVAAMFAFKLYQGGYLRFILPADIALALLVARGVWMGLTIARPGALGAGQNGWMGLVVVALAAVGLAPTLLSLNNLYFEPDYARDDYRAIAHHLQEVAGPHDAIILNGPNQWEVFTYYYPPSEVIHRLPSDRTEAELDGILATSERVYAVFYGENERDPQRVVEGTLDARAFEADTRWYGNVRLVTYGVSGLPGEGPAVTLDARFGQHIRLLGYTLDDGDAVPGGLLKLALFWETDAPLDESYSVFVHLLDSGQNVVAQHDGVPGGGLAFTDLWSLGEVIEDHHGVLISPDALRGEYTLVVGLFIPETGERLPAALDQADVGEHLALSTFSLK